MNVLWEMHPKLDEFKKMFDSKFEFLILADGALTYIKNMKGYDVSSLKEKELNYLITKSVDDGVDYVFERVKDKEIYLNFNYKSGKFSFGSKKHLPQNSIIPFCYWK